MSLQVFHTASLKQQSEKVYQSETAHFSAIMASLGPKKDGSPNAEYFNSAESLQGFESVRMWLQKNSKKVCFA